MRSRLVIVLAVGGVVLLPVPASAQTEDEPEYLIEVVELESRVEVDEQFDVLLRLWEAADPSTPYERNATGPFIELRLPNEGLAAVTPTFSRDGNDYFAVVELPAAGDWIATTYPAIEDRASVPGNFAAEYEVRVVEPPPGYMTALITGILIAGLVAVLWMTRQRRRGPPPPPHPQTDSWWHSP